MTNFVTIDPFEEGEWVTASDMNNIAQSLVHIHEILGDDEQTGSVAIRYDYEDVDWQYQMIHRYRYLEYVGKTIVSDNPNLNSEATNQVTFQSEQGSSPNEYPIYLDYADLDSIDWLVYGQLYYIKNSYMVVESAKI